MITPELKETLEAAEKGNKEAQYRMGTISEENQEYEQAHNWYLRAAKQGYADAYYCLARLFENGYLNPADNVSELNMRKAVNYYAIAAVLGNPDGQKKLADFYFHGTGVGQNLENAIDWYENASNRNNREAQCALGQIYAGRGEYKRAYDYFYASANNHYNAAQYELGILFLKGQGVQADEQAAIHWLSLSMEQMYVPAILKLAEVYKQKKTVDGYREALSYYLKASSFSAEAERNIAEFYYYGYGDLSADTAQAFSWYVKAADHGDADAQYMIASAYCNDIAAAGVHRGYKQAAAYLKKAADQKHVAAAYDLAMLYKQKLISNTADYRKAYPYFLIAAEEGHVKAMFETAEILWNGLNGNKDTDAAISWYEKCALKGNWYAQQKLINSYRNGINCKRNYSEVIRIASLKPASDAASAQVAAGEALRIGGFGVSRNYKESYEWYRKAAEQGDAEASYWVGYFLRYGDGVQKDTAAALNWYERAAKKDYLQAIVGLGYMYGNGIGTVDGKPDYDKAVYYYKLGVEAGSSTAYGYLAYSYYKGYGIEKDYKKAFNLYYRAAQEPKRAYAQRMVAKMYEEGIGTGKDLPAAFSWYKKAADHKDIFASYKTGYMLANGIGTARDLSKSVTYFRFAADGGDVQANDEAGNAYLYGIGTREDYKTAYKYILFAAGKKVHRSEYNLGVMYQRGLYLERSDKLAEEWFSLAAKGGHKEAQYQMGEYHVNRKEYDLAFNYYSLSANQNHAAAQNMCGKFFAEGWGSIKKDSAKANEYFRMAAEQGNESGAWNLGLNYYSGFGIEKDYTKAFHYIFSAANKGHKSACNKTGEMLEAGQGVSQNIREALQWYLKAASSPFLMPKAQLNLGKLYASEGFSDFQSALIWYKKAQSNNDADVKIEASQLLGDLYYYGTHVEQNDTEAFNYYKLCAEKANAQIRFNLAELYLRGCGIRHDIEKAIYWYQKALEKDVKHAEASWRLGMMYLKGIHLDRNDDKAEELLAAAADSNHTGACAALGNMILENRCKRHNSGQAVTYLEKAADARNVDAMYKVGMIYESGQLVQKDYTRAFNYIRGAATRGHAEAMFVLYKMYAKGKGVKRNRELAKTWLQNAADNGNEEAVKRANGYLKSIFHI